MSLFNRLSFRARLAIVAAAAVALAVILASAVVFIVVTCWDTEVIWVRTDVSPS